MSYQAIYDATKAAIDEFLQSNVTPRLMEGLAMLTNECTRPSVLFRPKISPDGDQWCALFGNDLASGVAGFGSTPDAAMRAFDSAWINSAWIKSNR